MHCHAGSLTLDGRRRLRQLDGAVYADGAPGAAACQTPVVVSTRTAAAATVLSVALAPSGGQAVMLKPD